MNRESPKIVVLVAINDFLMGGAQKLVADTFHHLDPDKYELHLLVLFDFKDKDTFFHYLPAYVKVHRLRMRRLFSIRGWGGLARVLREVRPGIIISHLFFSNMVMRMANVLRKTPVIVVEHNIYANKNAVQHGIDWSLSWLTDYVVAVSAAVARFLEHRQHILKRKIVIIPNGIDIEALKESKPAESRAELRAGLGLADDEIVILRVGRLVPQKDPRLMIEGFALFMRQNSLRCRLVVVGSGELGEQLKSDAQTLGVADAVMFVGATDPHRFYALSDLFVSTSIMEGFAIAYAEALWYGLPVVTTDTGGVEELVQDGVNGVVIRARTPEAVAESLLKAIRAGEPMRTNAKLSGARYSILETVRQYESLIQKLVRNPK